MKFNDRQGNRDRTCYFGVVFEGKFFPKDEAVKGKLAVFVQLSYQKNGKWSNSTWQVETKSAKLVVGMEPFEGWMGGVKGAIAHLQKQALAAEREPLTDNEALAFFQACWPRTFARLSAVPSVDDLR
ncbi:MAG: hypothetical protein Q8P44_02100 [Dehalococcoidia bacterium]|nr:hypothetical protein [Dehalococcoidia bacterium]